MDIRLAIELTPLPTYSELASKSPKSYLWSPAMLSTLQRKTGLMLLATNQEKFRLDPQSRPEETTILEYHTRVSTQQPQDCGKIHATIPFTKTLTKMLKERKSLMNRVSEMENKINALEMANLTITNEISALQSERLSLYISNLLVDFIGELYRRQGCHLPSGAGNDSSHSTTRYTQAAQQINKQNLRDVGLDSKYHRVLQRFSKYNDARNFQAHSTRIAFAKLLVSPHFQQTHHGKYEYWGGLFPFCYGETVEVIASSIDDDDDDDDLEVEKDDNKN